MTSRLRVTRPKCFVENNHALVGTFGAEFFLRHGTLHPRGDGLVEDGGGFGTFEVPFLTGVFDKMSRSMARMGKYGVTC